MPPGRKRKLEPWIEQTILNGNINETKQGALGACIIEVGNMSASQAHVATGPTEVLFLSDGKVQMPGILTQKAWDELQELEGRTTLTSLTQWTVIVYSYTLKFYMNPKKTRCRFFLSISELISTGRKPVKDYTPCCTTLYSVREKISATWRSLLLSDSSASTQEELCLSQLLGEWMDDRMEEMKTRVKDLLKQPSCPITPWAADRIRYQGEERFTVPASHLDIPVEQNLLLQTPSDEGSHTLSGLVPPPGDRQTDPPILAQHMESIQPIANQNTASDEGSHTLSGLIPPSGDGQTVPPLPAQDMESIQPITNQNTASDGSSHTMCGLVPPPGARRTDPSVCAQHTESIHPIPNQNNRQADGPAVHTITPHEQSIDGDMGPEGRVSPWAMVGARIETLPTSFSSNESKSQSLLDPSPPALLPRATSTQLPSQDSRVSSRSEDVSLPPYQRPRPSSDPVPISSSLSATWPDTGGPPGTDTGAPPHNPTPTPPGPATTEQQERKPLRPRRNKRPLFTETAGESLLVPSMPSFPTTTEQRHGKRGRPRKKPSEEDEESLLAAAGLPSWLLESQRVPGREEGHGCQQKATAARKTPNVHSDGTSFRYSYRTSEKTLQNLSKIKVPDLVAQWAVKYLVNTLRADKDTPP